MIGPGFAANPDYQWAVPARDGRVRNRVIRVLPQQEGDKSSWKDDIYHSSDSECGETWFDVDMNVDGCALGCLAVVVGELLIEGASVRSDFHYIPLATQHSCSRCCYEGLHMICASEIVPRLVVVRLLNARRDEVHVLTGRHDLNTPCTTRSLNGVQGYDCLVAFYSEFWALPVSDRGEHRMRQIWNHIFKFCRDYRKARFGSGYKTAHLVILDSNSKAKADDGNDATSRYPLRSTAVQRTILRPRRRMLRLRERPTIAPPVRLPTFSLPWFFASTSVSRISCLLLLFRHKGWHLVLRLVVVRNRTIAA